VPPTAYPFNVVDVFTERRLEGNQLGVFLDAEEIPDDRMQAIARQLNVAETIFLSAPRTPDGAASARIFTPAREVPFAGHPTIGAAFALCTAGRIPAGAASFVLEERVGPVPIRLESRDPFFAWLRTPPIAFGKTYDREAVARALGVTPDDLIEGAPVQVVSAGNPFAYVALQTPEAVDRATLSEPALRCAAPGFDATGVFVFAPREGGAYSRMFAPMAGVPEDPATGSATGPLAAYMAAYGLCERREGLRLLSEQGVKMRRRSLVHALLHFSGNDLDYVEVGGTAVETIQGTVFAD
jgi:trans-2,3-dihydro-3-hydroxyanthranilate isomerase